MINVLGKRVAFLIAIAGAAVVGGATTALVTAAIPSSTNGQIHGCYRNGANITNVKGTLRVVDSEAGQMCTNQEASLNWPTHQRAFVNFKIDSTTDEPSVATSQNIDNVIFVANGYACVDVAFDPKTANSTGVIQNTVLIRGVSVEEDAEIDSYCTSGSNALVPVSSANTKVSFEN